MTGRRLRGLAQTLAATLVAALVLEALARLGSTFVADPSRPASPWFVVSPGLGWEPRPGFSGMVEGEFPRRFDDRGFVATDTRQIATARRPRVVFLGDSNTFGWGVPASATFVEVLDSLWTDADAINLAVPGYTAVQGRVVLRERALPLEPDLLVVSFGFNDRRAAMDPQAADGPAAFQRHWQRRARLPFLRRSYLYRGGRFLFEKAGLVHKGGGRPEEARVDRLVPRVAPEDYRESLAGIVRDAREAGVAVVFLRMGDDPVQSEYARRGVEALETGRIEEAIAALETAVAKDNAFSDVARESLARALDAAGRPEEEIERVLLTRAPRSIHGGRPLFLARDYDRVQDEVATALGVPVIDAASILAATPSDYLDFCHPDAAGHRKIARLLHERLPGMLAAR